MWQKCIWNPLWKTSYWGQFQAVFTEITHIVRDTLHILGTSAEGDASVMYLTTSEHLANVSPQQNLLYNNHGHFCEWKLHFSNCFPSIALGKLSYCTFHSVTHQFQIWKKKKISDTSLVQYCCLMLESCIASLSPSTHCEWERCMRRKGFS